MVVASFSADVLMVANWVANADLTSPPPAVAAEAKPSIDVSRPPAAVNTSPAHWVCSTVGGAPLP